MAEFLIGDDVCTESVKYLLKGIPTDIPITESLLKVALKQKKYTPKWVMLQFMDATSALVSVRVPRKSKNVDFTCHIRGKNVKATKLTNVEESEFELMLNSSTMDMFYSVERLKEIVEDSIKEMMEVENKDLFLGKKGDIKYDFIAATSRQYEVHPFGSRTMGLGYKNSDYDVFVDMDHYYMGGGETKLENSVQLIRDMLRNSRTFSDLILIPRARVPVLKARHKGSGIQCDFSTINAIGVENSKLLRNYLSSDRQIRFVATAVKVWARRLGLTQAGMGPGALTSYCMLWLVFFSLMQDSPKAVLPVFNVKEAHEGPKLFIDGWDCSFCGTVPLRTKNNQNEVQLLYQFFSFYGSLDYLDVKNNVICPYLGTMIPVKQFTKTKLLTEEFKNYKKQASRSRFYEMSCDSVMVVQDPIEQNHNIAKGVDDWVLDRFLKLCKTTKEIMEYNMNSYLNSMNKI